MNYLNVAQRQKVSKCCWKTRCQQTCRVGNPQCRVATNLQLIKSISAKCNKMRYACI